MADDVRNSVIANHNRIDLSEPYEARDWARRFNVSIDELAYAVQKVGLAPSAVEQYLKTH